MRKCWRFLFDSGWGYVLESDSKQLCSTHSDSFMIMEREELRKKVHALETPDLRWLCSPVGTVYLIQNCCFKCHGLLPKSNSPLQVRNRRAFLGTIHGQIRALAQY